MLPNPSCPGLGIRCPEYIDMYSIDPLSLGVLEKVQYSNNQFNPSPFRVVMSICNLKPISQSTTYLGSIFAALTPLLTKICSQSTPLNILRLTGTISSHVLMLVSGHCAALSGNFSLSINTETPQFEQNLCCWTLRPIMYSLRLLPGSEMETCGRRG